MPRAKTSVRTQTKVRSKARTIPDPITDQILDALEEKRQTLGVSLHQLAKESGTQYGYVQQMLRSRHVEDKRHSPTLDKLGPIARALGYTLKLVRVKKGE